MASYPGPLARPAKGFFTLSSRERKNYIKIGVMSGRMRNRRCLKSQADSVACNGSEQLSCSAGAVLCPLFSTYIPVLAVVCLQHQFSATGKEKDLRGRPSVVQIEILK